MREESIKRQRRDIANAVYLKFKPFGWKREMLSGDPFDMRVYRPGLSHEWLFRCIPAVTNRDKDIVRNDERPPYCIKGVAFRPTPRSREVCFLEIK
ncbi:MAG: hypothetical protein ACYDH3_00045 [Candidatus Aminicenantales bacterium]